MPHTKLDQFEHDSPGRKLSILQRLNMAHLSGPLSEIGIARGSFSFIMAILRHEGIIQEDLTQSLCIDRAATARAIQILMKEGFVYREDDPGDRRKKRVYPTEKAKALQDEVINILQAHNDILFAGLDTEEQIQFLKILDRLIENIYEKIHNKSIPQAGFRSLWKIPEPGSSSSTS